jgi:hypothetical protein
MSVCDLLLPKETFTAAPDAKIYCGCPSPLLAQGGRSVCFRRANQTSTDTASADSSVRKLVDEDAARRLRRFRRARLTSIWTLVGSYASVARMLDEVSAVPGTTEAMLIFDDFMEGIENFPKKIQPLMKCRVPMLRKARPRQNAGNTLRKSKGACITANRPHHLDADWHAVGSLQRGNADAWPVH